MPGVLPHSLDVERALLGSMIVYPGALVTAYDQNLSEEDFFDAANKKVFRAIMQLHDQNKPVDVASVITRLNDLKDLGKAGGADYIASLTDLAISESSADYYIRLLQEKTTLRNLIEICENAAREGENVTDLGSYLAETEKNVLNITRNIKVGNFVTSSTAIKEVVELMRKLQSSRDMSGVRSGFSDLDRVTFGFQKGDLIILAARPSVGKTAFALNIAINASLNYGASVALFSLEMGYKQLGMRMLSAVSHVYSERIRTGQYLSNEDWARISNAAEKLERANIFIDDNSAINVPQISAKCRKLKADGKLDIIIIDYLQLIAPASRHADNRQQEVSEISRSLKQLAREMEVPVIALSQLSRSVEQRKGNNKPILSDLRESGAIEQDADVVIFLHRDDYFRRDKEEEEQPADPDACVPVDVLVAKHRNGQTADLKLMLQKSINAFFDMKEYGE